MTESVSLAGNGIHLSFGRNKVLRGVDISAPAGNTVANTAAETAFASSYTIPANTLQEFAAYVRANPSSVQFGSAGAGSTGHLFCELLNAALGIKDVTHVPYRGGGPAMQDLIAGRYDC